jgi:hypothetical protein
MNSIIELVIPFIALAILSVMIDRFTLFLEGIMHRIPKLPDKFEWWFAYVVILGLSFLVCWQGDFNLFVYLDFHFWYLWEGYLITALVISGGSSFVRSQFEIINDIPSVVMGATTSVSKFLRRASVSKQQADALKVTKKSESVQEMVEETVEQAVPSFQPSAVSSYDEPAVEEVVSDIEEVPAVEEEPNYTDSNRYGEI